jgi:competence protein ComEC
VDRVLFIGLALATGGLCVVAPWHVAAGLVVVTAAARWLRQVETRWLVLALLAALLGAWRATRAVTAQEAVRERARAELPRPSRCSGSGRVTGTPQRVRGTLRFEATLGVLTCEDTAAAGGATMLYGGPPDLARGDDVEVVAQLASPERFWNEVDPRPGEARRAIARTGGAVDVRIVRHAAGVLAWIDRARARIRTRIDATFPDEAGPMARALVLGEADLAPEDDAAFRASGLSHLLAVSGMHLVLVVAGAVAACKGLLVRVERLSARWDVARLAAALGLPLAWLYAGLAGASGSTVRAACMASVALAAQALGRASTGPRALGVSILAMAVVDPLVAFDVSFLLSAAATGGILALARPIGAALAARLPKVLAPVAASLGVTLAATLPCAPILAGFAPTLALGGLVANLVAVPIGEAAALPLCLLHTLLGPLPLAERGCALAGGGALLAVRASVPALALPVPPPTASQLTVLAVAAALWGLGVRMRSAAGALVCALVLVLELEARRAGAPHGLLRATFLDVGQGDAALVDLPDGGALLIDGGGLVGSPVDTGVRVIAPTLRARRRSTLEAVILSHPHPDHFGGLVTGTDQVRVTAVWDTGQGEREGTGGAYAALLARSRRDGVPVLRPSELCGAHIVSGAVVEVLAPCPAPWPDRGPNDNSLVVRVSYGNRALLFLGDAELAEERDLVARIKGTGAGSGTAAGGLGADVVKVGHHGSRTSSSPALLAAIGAHDAVVSTGVRNRFGHPHPTTLLALSAANLRIWRTDLGGAVTVETDGQALRVSQAAGSSLHRGEGAGIWSP